MYAVNKFYPPADMQSVRSMSACHNLLQYSTSVVPNCNSGYNQSTALYRKSPPPSTTASEPGSSYNANLSSLSSHQHDPDRNLPHSTGVHRAPHQSLTSAANDAAMLTNLVQQVGSSDVMTKSLLQGVANIGTASVTASGNPLFNSSRLHPNSSRFLSLTRIKTFELRPLVMQ